MGIVTFAKITNFSVDRCHFPKLGIPFNHLDKVFFVDFIISSRS